MKKFLSLLLSLVLALSLATASAGAAETAVSTQKASPLDKYLGQYIRISNAAIPGMGPYTVFCTTNSKGNTCLQFGKDLTAADRRDMLNKLNGSGLGQKAFIPDTKTVTLASQSQVDAWKGGADQTVSGPIGVKIADGANNTHTVTVYARNYAAGRGDKVSLAQAQAALAEKLGRTVTLTQSGSRYVGKVTLNGAEHTYSVIPEVQGKLYQITINGN